MEGLKMPKKGRGRPQIQYEASISEYLCLNKSLEMPKVVEQCLKFILQLV